MSVLAACALTVVIFLWHWRRSGWGLVDYLGIGFWYCYARLWHRWSSNGPAPLPAKGPAILVSNHTCSADPSFLTAGCARRLSFLLAQEFYGFALVDWLFDFLHCVPVRRDGKDALSVRLSLHRLEEGRVLCIFPQGGLSHVGRNAPIVAKAGIAYIALRSRVPVYPALIRKGPQTSKVLDSWLKPSRGVQVTFGPPLDLANFYNRPVNRKLLEEMTRYIMRRIIDLGKQGKQETRNKKQETRNRNNGRSTIMSTAATASELTSRHCAACEGGIPKLSADQVKEYLAKVPEWKQSGDGQRIRREWRVKDFATALDFFKRAGDIAEQEDHHPDLHLTGYRNVAIELSTHAIKGLSENDFILAAKIDQLPVELKK